jgi:hypothetical protein
MSKVLRMCSAEQINAAMTALSHYLKLCNLACGLPLSVLAVKIYLGR